MMIPPLSVHWPPALDLQRPAPDQSAPQPTQAQKNRDALFRSLPRLGGIATSIFVGQVGLVRQLRRVGQVGLVRPMMLGTLIGGTIELGLLLLERQRPESVYANHSWLDLARLAFWDDAFSATLNMAIGRTVGLGLGGVHSIIRGMAVNLVIGEVQAVKNFDTTHGTEDRLISLASGALGGAWAPLLQQRAKTEVLFEITREFGESLAQIKFDRQAPQDITADVMIESLVMSFSELGGSLAGHRGGVRVFDNTTPFQPTPLLTATTSALAALTGAPLILGHTKIETRTAPELIALMQQRLQQLSHKLTVYEVSDFLSVLNDPNPSHRQQACDILSELLPKRSLHFRADSNSALIAVTSDSDPAVRIAATKALGLLTKHCPQLVTDETRNAFVHLSQKDETQNNALASLDHLVRHQPDLVDELTFKTLAAVYTNNQDVDYDPEPAVLAMTSRHPQWASLDLARRIAALPIVDIKAWESHLQPHRALYQLAQVDDDTIAHTAFKGLMTHLERNYLKSRWMAAKYVGDLLRQQRFQDYKERAWNKVDPTAMPMARLVRLDSTRDALMMAYLNDPQPRLEPLGKNFGDMIYNIDHTYGISTSVSELLAEVGVTSPALEDNSRFTSGRTLVFPDEISGDYLVIKYARHRNDPIINEAFWYDTLAQQPGFKTRFPRPLKREDKILDLHMDDGRRAIAFWAHPNYYHYLDDPSIPWNEFVGGLNAFVHDNFLLAEHDALHTVPLVAYHASDSRRMDGGAFYMTPSLIWGYQQAPAMGDLIEWRKALQKANFGVDGVRDGEEIMPRQQWAESIKHDKRFRDKAHTVAVYQQEKLRRVLFAATLMVGNRMVNDAQHYTGDQPFYENSQALKPYANALADIYAHALMAKTGIDLQTARQRLAPYADYESLARQFYFNLDPKAYIPSLKPGAPVSQFPASIYGNLPLRAGFRYPEHFGEYDRDFWDNDIGFYTPDAEDPTIKHGLFGTYSGAFPAPEFFRASWSVFFAG